MNPSIIRAASLAQGSHFFTRSNMRFAGDTMANYGVRAQTVMVETHSGETVECWELYRKRPVKCGLRSPAYFAVNTLKRVHAK